VHHALLHQRPTPVEDAPVVEVVEVRRREDFGASEGRFAVVFFGRAVGVSTSTPRREAVDETRRRGELHKLDGVDSFAAAPVGREGSKAFDHLFADVDGVALRVRKVSKPLRRK
jgi:hypothetical protein